MSKNTTNFDLSNLDALTPKQRLAALATLQAKAEQDKKAVEKEVQAHIGNLVGALNKAEIPTPHYLADMVGTLVNNYDRIPNRFNENLSKFFSSDPVEAFKAFAQTTYTKGYKDVLFYFDSGEPEKENDVMVRLRKKGTRKTKAKKAETDESK